MGLNLPKKTYKHEFGEHLTVVLKEMCSRVNVDYNKIPFQDKEMHYYWKHEWTEQEQEEFIKWLTNYLYNNTKARREIMSLSHKNKKRCRKSADEFNLWYGWKTSHIDK